MDAKNNKFKCEQFFNLNGESFGMAVVVVQLDDE